MSKSSGRLGLVLTDKGRHSLQEERVGCSLERGQVVFQLTCISLDVFKSCVLALSPQLAVAAVAAAAVVVVGVEEVEVVVVVVVVLVVLVGVVGESLSNLSLLLLFLASIKLLTSSSTSLTV